ncbi:hypothetical protein ABIA40_002515 [Bradyrhizobium sp. USDA 223]
MTQIIIASITATTIATAADHEHACQLGPETETRLKVNVGSTIVSKHDISEYMTLAGAVAKAIKDSGLRATAITPNSQDCPRGRAANASR